jgi:hypothetical protein
MEIDRDQIRYLGDVRRLVLAPSDIIVISIDAAVSAQSAENIKRHVEKAAPGHKCLVLDNGLKIGVLAPT